MLNKLVVGRFDPLWEGLFITGLSLLVSPRRDRLKMLSDHVPFRNGMGYGRLIEKNMYTLEN